MLRTSIITKNNIIITKNNYVMNYFRQKNCLNLAMHALLYFGGFSSNFLRYALKIF